MTIMTIMTHTEDSVDPYTLIGPAPLSPPVEDSHATIGRRRNRHTCLFVSPPKREASHADRQNQEGTP